MKHILMVDDVATNLRCATEILKDQYEITAVRSGEKALEVLEELTPDLVLLDINMPGMNGFEVFDRMKRMPGLSQIPVVFLTAVTDKDKEACGRKMGAADFIRKPYEPDELSSRIKKVFEDCSGMSADRMRSSRFFSNERNQESVRIWANDSKTKGYFILFNLDRFEQVKEEFGPEAEQSILMKIADILAVISESDKCFCHVKDSCFATYIEGSYSKDTMKAIIRKLIAGLEFEINEDISEEFELKITISAGIASKPADGKSYEELKEHADKALYFVRESGKGRYHFYNSKTGEIREAAEDRETINLLQLKRQFEGRNMENADSQECLQKAYHVVSRYWECVEGETQIIFFGIEDDADEHTIEFLSEVIKRSLRKGDVAVKCGETQYVAVLQNTSLQNGEMVAKRIKKKFEETGKAKKKLVFEMKEA